MFLILFQYWNKIVLFTAEQEVAEEVCFPSITSLPCFRCNHRYVTGRICDFPLGIPCNIPAVLEICHNLCSCRKGYTMLCHKIPSGLCPLLDATPCILCKRRSSRSMPRYLAAETDTGPISCICTKIHYCYPHSRWTWAGILLKRSLTKTSGVKLDVDFK